MNHHPLHAPLFAALLAREFVRHIDASGRALCLSTLRCDRAPHDAEWYATAPCGESTPVCEARRRSALHNAGWRCRHADGRGCGDFHPYQHIEFHRI